MDLEAALREAFGVPFQLWTRKPPWTPCGEVPPDADQANADDEASDYDGLFDAVLSTPDAPLISTRPDGASLVIVPMPRRGRYPMVAVGRVASEPPELLRRLGALALRDLRARQELAEKEQDIDACARQMTQDLEQLIYLTKLAKHLELCEVSRPVADAAEAILPELRSIIHAETVVLFSLPGSFQKCELHEAPIGPAVAWAGSRAVPESLCRRLIEYFRECADDEPVSINRLDQREESAEFPGVESLLLAPVVKGDLQVGWLLALNRITPDDAGPAAEDYPRWGLSDFEFGSVEAQVVRVTTGVLATHMRNIRLFQKMCDAVKQAKSESVAKARKAFTLVELVIVVLIVGIMAAVGVPRFIDSISYHRAEAAAKRIRLDIELARRSARLASADRSIEFDTDAHSYTLGGTADLDHRGADYSVRLGEAPYQAAIASADFGGDAVLTFDGYGAADTSGTVVVQAGPYQKTITIEQGAGKATIQ
jgi:prepilin-type N-terminal cleavage/methylation domain-containing protein